jgi:hypothetical protein
MVWTPSYGLGGWRDLPNESTEIDAAALNNYDAGILDAHALIGSGGSTDTGKSVVFAVFNEVTNTWPLRSSVTTSPTQVVIWVGNAKLQDPGGEGPVAGVDLWYGPLNGSSVIPGDTPPATENPDPVTGISMTAPAHSEAGATITLSGTLTTTTSTTFAFLQIATRGPGGQKIDTGFRPGVTVDGTITLNGSVTATQSGTWTVFVTYNLTGAADGWVDGPTVAFTVTVPENPTPPTGTPGAIPLLSGRSGGSGLPWNSGTFQSGNSVSANQTFGTWRNRPIDAFVTFQGRDTWSNMFTIDSSWAAFTGLIINSIPPQPTGQNDSATAAGTNNQRWRDYGSALTAAGLNRDTYMLRIWEVNGDWYDWAMGGGQNSPATFVAAMRNLSTSVKATAPNIKISVNFNRGNSFGATWQTAVMDPLIQTGPSGRYVDNIGLDTYDWYPGQTNLSNWNSAKAQNPGLDSIATYCRANGIQMSLEEWALVSSSGGSAGNGGGDNPYYITQMWDWFVANSDILSYEGYYNNPGAPSTLQHVISTGAYPNAAAAYRSTSRWGA